LALEELYKEVILDHYKNPRNKRDLPEAELSCSKNNPLCGDEVTVHAHVADGRLAEVTFEGQGCSISQASASMMTEAMTGKPVPDAEALAAEFRSMMEGGHEPDEDEFGDLVALKGVVKYPVRIKCAVLAWDVLQDALADAPTGPSPEAGAGEATGSAPHIL
jgi:nitrogen fixation protein NifU and related proteins